MKTIVLCSITLLTVAPAFAQTSAPATAAQANKPITLTGCVGSSADSSGFTLGNAMVIPGTPQPGQIDQTPSPLLPTVPPSATQATPAAPVPPATSAAAPPPVTAPASPTPAGTTGTTSAGTTATAGTSGTTPTSVTGTSGVVAGGATANATSNLGGYRLSGTDMKPWVGQRVQVTGTFSPSPATAAGTVAIGRSGAPAAPPLEFKVQTVQPASGPCPK